MRTQTAVGGSSWPHFPEVPPQLRWFFAGKGRHRFRKSGIVIGDHPTSNHPFDFDVGVVFFCGFCKVFFFKHTPRH